MNQNAPLTMTEVAADRMNDEAPYKFKLLETIQNISGPLKNGRMVSSVKTYGIQNWGKALENLDWD